MDPWRNDRDGAMLHTVRHYQPERVILFFTQSIWEGRFAKAGHQAYDWQKIIQTIAPKSQVELIQKEIAEEHDFDGYKEIFHQQLSQLRQAHPSAEILLNVTSGTPQMETTLCLEYITNPQKLTCIQVAKPIASSNARRKFATPEEQEIDLEIVNQEEQAHASRCKEVAIISFKQTMIRKQLESLIDNYDYEVAIRLLESHKDTYQSQ
ncbi:MAG: type III-A CRISPR-associated CARF protein Csm6 [Enterococcus sp.]